MASENGIDVSSIEVGKRYVIRTAIYQIGYWNPEAGLFHSETHGGFIPTHRIKEVRGPIDFDSLPLVTKAPHPMSKR